MQEIYCITAQSKKSLREMVREKRKAGLICRGVVIQFSGWVVQRMVSRTAKKSEEK